METTIIVINGKGGVGKDWCINQLISKMGEELIENISSIDPIKKIASEYGYDDSKKTNKSRKFLSDLKAAFTEWNELPMVHTIRSVRDAINAERNKKVVFVHIREPEEIKKFIDSCKIALMVDNIKCNNDFRIVTLLIIDPEDINTTTPKGIFGNGSDDNVEKFKYDYKFINDKINGKEDDFYDFCIKNIIDTKEKSVIETTGAITVKSPHFVKEK